MVRILISPYQRSSWMFSLLEEPWIPLVSTSGMRTIASISDALLTPSQWRGIDSTNPVECLAIHRLLLAICHRAIGPGTTEQRGALLDSWPTQQIQTYLQQWADRFDLFDPVRPFLQVAALKPAGHPVRPWTLLCPDRASGSSRLLWDHSIDANPEPITPAAAARALVGHLQFALGGTIRQKQYSGAAGPLVGILVITPVGNTLQEGLALSLVGQSAAEHQLDLPPWERDPLQLSALTDPVKPTVPAGPAQRYTWLGRAVLLLPPSLWTDSVTGVLYDGGERIAESPVPDPMAAMVTGKKGPMPLMLREARAMWRDANALMGAEGSVPPETIRNAAAIRMGRGEFDPIDLLAGGFCHGAELAKPGIWRLEERRISPALLAQGNAVAVAQAALDLAESTGTAMRKAAFSLFASWLQKGGEHSPATSDITGLLDSTQVMAHYWASLEPEFWSLIDQLSTTTDADAIATSWANTLKRTVNATWNNAIRSLGTDGRALAAAGRSSHQLGRVLKPLLSAN